MRKHLKYFKYVMRHKWFVCVAGYRIGASWYRLAIHDWSKFTWTEWIGYCHNFYGTDKSKFNKAWLLHQRRNKHHWQYWILYFDNSTYTTLPMPNKYIKEMIADWSGAGRTITGEWKVVEWYKQNEAKIKLHPDTRNKVELLLGIYEVQ